MDNNTFQLLLAIVATVQVIALAYLGVRTHQAATASEQTKELVNGQSHALNELTKKAAFAEGVAAAQAAAGAEPRPVGPT